MIPLGVSIGKFALVKEGFRKKFVLSPSLGILIFWKIHRVLKKIICLETQIHIPPSVCSRFFHWTSIKKVFVFPWHSSLKFLHFKSWRRRRVSRETPRTCIDFDSCRFSNFCLYLNWGMTSSVETSTEKFKLLKGIRFKNFWFGSWHRHLESQKFHRKAEKNDSSRTSNLISTVTTSLIFTIQLELNAFFTTDYLIETPCKQFTAPGLSKSEQSLKYS